MPIAQTVLTFKVNLRSSKALPSRRQESCDKLSATAIFNSTINISQIVAFKIQATRSESTGTTKRILSLWQALLARHQVAQTAIVHLWEKKIKSNFRIACKVLICLFLGLWLLKETNNRCHVSRKEKSQRSIEH